LNFVLRSQEARALGSTVHFLGCCIPDKTLASGIGSLAPNLYQNLFHFEHSRLLFAR